MWANSAGYIHMSQAEELICSSAAWLLLLGVCSVVLGVRIGKE